MAPSEDNVALRESSIPGMGTALVARRAFARGSLILRELPLLLVNEEAWRHDPRVVRDLRKVPGSLEAFAAYWAFRDAPESVRAQVLSLYSPTSGAREQAYRERLLSSGCRTGEDVEETLKVFSVFNFNAVSVGRQNEDGSAGDDELGMGLYLLACRMNHSCAPNCTWLSDNEGRRVVRAITPLQVLNTGERGGGVC